jgi:sulfhydrogenase subunit beta (sulfur reductase)
MSTPLPKVGEQVVLETRHFDQLLAVLSTRGYLVMGPTVREGGIVYEPATSTSDFPVGWADEQGGGKYRLIKGAGAALFGYNVGPQSWKKVLHPPAVRLWRARRENAGSASGSGQGFQIVEDRPEPEKLALVGVRACDLQAIMIQDRVFLQGAYVDPGYKARRENIFIVAVNCTQAGANCFCASLGTGPKASSGFDLALTEILGDRHSLVVEVGSELGAAILEQVPHSEATVEDRSAAEEAVAKAASEMGHCLDTTELKEMLYRNYDNPLWGQVATRCLSCSNCTLVCPTCFCTTVEDVTDLTGEHAERWRKWDSCFTLDFSYIHGGSIRPSVSSRYRQWLMHKLATWMDQFGTFGCVGCGRCITWCPVGIDITEQVRAIRESEHRQVHSDSTEEKKHEYA